MNKRSVKSGETPRAAPIIFFARNKDYPQPSKRCFFSKVLKGENFFRKISRSKLTLAGEAH
jgi:hypothetical protein